jgi:hypothetical protein
VSGDGSLKLRSLLDLNFGLVQVLATYRITKDAKRNDDQETK